MQIRHMIATFGKLHHDELSLTPGLNLIYAPNESGKSTWVHFLRTMFYGLNTRDRGPLADKNRFVPWNGSSMQGQMDVVHHGTAYTVTRTTHRANSPMGEFHCTYTDTATEVADITAQNCGEFLLSVPREVFERSAFIGQSAMVVGQDNELERRITSLITSGEEDISYSESYARLKKQLNRRKANSRVGQIPALEREIDTVQRQLDTLQDLEGQANTATQHLTQLRTQQQELLAQQSQWERLEAQQLSRNYQDAQEAAQLAEQRAILLDELTANLPGDAELSCLAAQAAAVLQAQHSVKQAQQAAQQARQSAEAAQTRCETHPLYPRTEAQLHQQRSELEPPAVPKSPLAVEIILFLCGLLSFFAKFFLPHLHAPWPSVLLGASIVFVLSAVGTFLWDRRRRKAIISLQAERVQQRAAFDEAADVYRALQKEADIALDRAQQAETAASDLQKGQQEQLYTLLWQVQLFQDAVTDLSGAQVALNEARQRRAAAVTARQNAENAALRCQILREQLPDSIPSPDEIIVPPVLSKEQLQPALQQTNAALIAAQTHLDTLTGQIRALGDRDDLQSRLTQLHEQLTQQQQEYDALSLAMEVLSQANTTLQNRFSPALGECAAEVFRQITNGKYEKVLLSRDFSLSAEPAFDPTMRSVQLLSQGAADQLYLAVRLAICDMVLPSENSAPLILDDALMSFDDIRLHAALDYLVEESKKRQILLFTCQKREQEYLSGRQGVAFLAL